jgi:DNA modification methylase
MPPRSDRKGRVCLAWPGKRLRCNTAASSPLTPVERFGGDREPWRNQLILGDNMAAMAALLHTYAGQVRLIYIDPPFATGHSYAFRSRIGAADVVEELAFEDDLPNGMPGYLQFMYERLGIMHQLLSEDGSIFVHCDYRANSHLRLLLDELFGPESFRNEIITRRAQTKSLQKQFASLRSLNVFHDTILWYSKSPDARFPGPYKPASAAQRRAAWQSLWNNADRPTMRYPLLGCTISRGQWKWREERALRAAANYQHYLEHHAATKTLTQYWEETGRTLEFVRRNGSGRPAYWIPPRDRVLADTNWLDIPAYSYSTGYETEKSEALLERVIQCASNPGDIVADPFCGSGTTAVVAERTGRRWLACDSARRAVQVARKRLLQLPSRSPFDVVALDAGPQRPSPSVEVTVDGHTVAVRILGVPTQHLNRLPSSVAAKVLRHPVEAVEYWAVDWEYDGVPFRNCWRSFRHRRGGGLETVARHTYAATGTYRIGVLATDIFGEEGFAELSVRVG